MEDSTRKACKPSITLSPGTVPLLKSPEMAGSPGSSSSKFRCSVPLDAIVDSTSLGFESPARLKDRAVR